MARVALHKQTDINDPVIAEIFAWVTEMEGAVPNHFFVELNFPEYFKAKLGSTQVLWQMGELTLVEIQHIGILVSRANGCAYCTGAFCTILNYGLDTPEAYVEALAEQGVEAVQDQRLQTILGVALKANSDPKAVTDEDIKSLRDLGLTDKGVVQLIHLVSDFGSYNRLNLALDTDYDYRDIWRNATLTAARGPGEGD
ncbi:MAG: hypothetical protein JKY89_09395 [Immundisolibacteraceae bacterium]|nr:hypothetical protein [Immundisolibacteraceae bacterium]